MAGGKDESSLAALLRHAKKLQKTLGQSGTSYFPSVNRSTHDAHTLDMNNTNESYKEADSCYTACKQSP